MALFTWVLGFVTGVLVFKFMPVLKKLEWYYLILAVIWYLLGVFTIAFARTSFIEGEATAGWMGTAIFGGFFVILGALIYFFGIRETQHKTDAGSRPAQEVN